MSNQKQILIAQAVAGASIIYLYRAYIKENRKVKFLTYIVNRNGGLSDADSIEAMKVGLTLKP